MTEFEIASMFHMKRCTVLFNNIYFISVTSKSCIGGIPLRESSEARVDSRDSVNKLNETDVLKSVSILS